MEMGHFMALLIIYNNSTVQKEHFSVADAAEEGLKGEKYVSFVSA